MSWWLMALVACVYLYTGVEYAQRKEWGMCLVFVAYALSNLGFVIDLLTRK
jgi:hypothetical protein